MDRESRSELSKEFLLGELSRQEETIEAQAALIVRMTDTLRQYVTLEEIRRIEEGGASE